MKSDLRTILTLNPFSKFSVYNKSMQPTANRGRICPRDPVAADPNR